MEYEWLMLADGAQVVGNKLYVLGGGWDILTVNTGFPSTTSAAIAVSIKVPWNHTNERHSLEIVVIDEDTSSEIAKIQGQFEVGRPPGIPAGQEQRFQMAAPIQLGVQRPGDFLIVGRIDGSDAKRFPFRVIAAPGVEIPNPPSV